MAVEALSPMDHVNAISGTGWLGRALVSFRQWRKATRDEMALAALSPRQRADIGVVLPERYPVMAELMHAQGRS